MEEEKTAREKMVMELWAKAQEQWGKLTKMQKIAVEVVVAVLFIVVTW